MAFTVGQKVICIYRYGENDLGIITPVFEATYTIRELDDRGNALALRLVEIINPPIRHVDPFGTIEPGWRASHFRPLVSRKTSIDVFTAMLNPVEEKELVK